MNSGGDPDRDDFGLPPVDMEIPDDARELDRDVQAYQRELRALRRMRRASRLRGPLARDGMVLPLLSGCLILALIASTLLIMFAADQAGVPQQPRNAATQPAAKEPAASAPPVAAGPPAVGQIGGPLPMATVVIGGKSVPLSAVTASVPSVLTLVPQNCRCAVALRHLGAQAAQAHVAEYLIGTGAAAAQLPGLAAQAGQDPARVADDTSGILAATYRQDGLTAILVRPDGSVAFVARSVPAAVNLEAMLRQLASA